MGDYQQRAKHIVEEHPHLDTKEFAKGLIEWVSEEQVQCFLIAFGYAEGEQPVGHDEHGDTVDSGG